MLSIDFEKLTSKTETITRLSYNATNYSKLSKGVFDFTYQVLGQEMNDYVEYATRCENVLKMYKAKLEAVAANSQTVKNQVTFIQESIKNATDPAQKAALESQLRDVNQNMSSVSEDIKDYTLIILQLTKMVIRNRARREAIYQAMLVFNPLIESHNQLNILLMLKINLNTTVRNLITAISNADRTGGDRIAAESVIAGQLFNIGTVVEGLYQLEASAFDDGVPLFADGANISDINQQGLGDCWVLSTIGLIARNHPDAIRQAIMVTGTGQYVVRLYDANGNPQFISVRISEFETSGSVALHSSTAEENWVAILEVAFSKSSNVIPLEGGGIRSIEGGTVTNSIGVWKGLTNNHASVEQIGHLTAQQRLAFVQMHLAAGHAVRADIWTEGYGMAQPASPPPWYIDGHAYAVVGAEHGMIQVRNPWGIGSPGADPTGVFNVTIDEFASIFGPEVMIGI